MSKNLVVKHGVRFSCNEFCAYTLAGDRAIPFRGKRRVCEHGRVWVSTGRQVPFRGGLSLVAWRAIMFQSMRARKPVPKD